MLTEIQARAWIDEMLGGETPAMRSVRSRTETLGLAHEEMRPSQVMVLRTLMLAVRAREVLELGTFLGYGATSFVEALDALGGGRLTTVDRDVALSNDAQANFPVDSKATRIDFLIGEANTVCANLLEAGRSFDLILLDVAERQYPALYDSCVGLLSPSGVLVVDNVMMATVQGWESGENVVEAPQSETMTAVRDLVARAARDQRVWASLVPLASGLLLCAKR